MGKFTLTFDTDNADFQESGLEKISMHILKLVSDKIDDGFTEGIIRDSNGNTIGRWAFEAEGRT